MMTNSNSSAKPFTLSRIAAALAFGVASSAVSMSLATSAYAQESNASLRGRVAADVEVTQVVAVDVDTGTRRTVTVSPDGRYNFASLRPGTYRLELTTPSGVRRTDAFTLAVAQNAVLDFGPEDLQPEPEAAVDTAADDGAIIITGGRLRTLEGAEVGDVVTLREIEQLPQINRNFLAFADTAPGVQFVTEGGGNTRIRGGAQGANAVNVFIDGISQKDYVLRGGITGQDTSPGNPFPQLAIGEYRVIGSNYKAEFDQVSSVAITAVTRSGTNQLEGEIFYDFTNQDFRSATPSEKDGDGKQDADEKQFGGALAGPIIPDKLFFFASYEGKRIDTPYTITPGAGVDVSALPTEYQGFFGSAVDQLTSDLYFGKLDFVPTDRDLFQLSVKHRDEVSENGNDGSNAEEFLSITEVREWRGVFRWEHTEDNWINDFKVSYEDVSWAPRPTIFETGNTFELGNDGQILSFGGGAGFQDKGQEGWTIQNDFTWVGLERHTIKVGIKTRWTKLNTLQQNFFNPQYDYNVLFNPDNPDEPGSGPFNDTIPRRVRFGAITGDGAAAIQSDNFQLGLYIQDDWEATDRLTINVGLRWDYEETEDFLNYVHGPDTLAAIDPGRYPQILLADYDINDFISTGRERDPFLGAFQPRIGFSYILDDQERFTLFGGYGRSYDRNQFDFLQQELTQGGYAVREFQFITGDPLRDCAPVSPTCLPFDPIYLTEEGRQQLLAGLPGGVGGRETRFIDNDLKIPYSDQFSLGVRGRFNLVEVEVGYRHVEGRDIFHYLLGNRRPDGSFFADGEPPNSPFGFAPPAFGSIIIGTNGGKTNEDVAHIKIDKRFTESSPWSLTSTYTYTQAEENVPSGGQFFLEYPGLENAPFVRSSGVPKHRWITTGAVDLPLEFTLSGRFLVQSPTYLNGIFNPTEPPFERDTRGIEADSSAITQLDLALTKYVSLGFLSDTARIRLRADVINVFNKANFTQFNGNPNDMIRDDASPTIFGERTGLGTGGYPPRTVKFTVGMSF